MNTPAKSIPAKLILSDLDLASLGSGEVGYIRKMKSDDLTARFPGLNRLAPGLDVWALFAANGMPIVLSDRQSAVLEGASDNEITPVWLN